MPDISDLKYQGPRYTDVRNDLDEHPITSDLVLVSDFDAIKTSVKNLLLTGMYERRCRPFIGSGLQKYLFENVNSVTGELIRRSIITMIQNFEPRAILISVSVRVDPDQNSYEATITFGVANLPGNDTVDLVLRRIR